MNAPIGLKTGPQPRKNSSRNNTHPEEAPINDGEMALDPGMADNLGCAVVAVRMARGSRRPWRWDGYGRPLGLGSEGRSRSLLPWRVYGPVYA